MGIDGSRLVSLDTPVMRERRRLQVSGIIFVSIILCNDGKLATDPCVSSAGLIDEVMDEKIYC